VATDIERFHETRRGDSTVRDSFHLQLCRLFLSLSPSSFLKTQESAMQIMPHASDSKLLAEPGKLFTSSTNLEQPFLFSISVSHLDQPQSPLLRLCFSMCYAPFFWPLLYRLPIKALQPSYLFSISQSPFFGSDSSRHERWRSMLLKLHFWQPWYVALKPHSLCCE
jgi:hypothetical protein